MFKRLSIVALAAPALLLAGCATTGADNRGLESVHQPVVTRTDFVFDMNAEDGRLAPGELQRLAGWLATLKLGYGDKVALDDPAGASAATRADVAAAVGRYGLFLEKAVPVSSAPPNPGTIRVIISRTTASVPSCPDNRDTGAANFNAHTSSDFGCAINSNLAAMIAEPEDLVRGQPGSVTSDPATGSKAIQALRKGSGSGGTGGSGAGASTTTGGGGGGSSGGASGGGAGK